MTRKPPRLPLLRRLCRYRIFSQSTGAFDHVAGETIRRKSSLELPVCVVVEKLTVGVRKAAVR